MNRIDIDKPIVKNNIIHYNYKVYGDWTEAFRDEEDFTIEYGCDISRGDYIGIQIDTEHREYFTVTDDGRVGMTSNKFTLYGTKPYARTIQCAQVDSTEFNA